MKERISFYEANAEINKYVASQPEKTQRLFKYFVDLSQRGFSEREIYEKMRAYAKKLREED